MRGTEQQLASQEGLTFMELCTYLLTKKSRRMEKITQLRTSPNCIMVIKSRRIIWTGRVERTSEMGNAYNILISKY
jgi:hypothetical protein